MILLHNVVIGEVQVDFGGGQPVVPQDLLERGERAALLQEQRGEGVPQHVGRDFDGDHRPVGHPLDDFLDLPGADRERIVEREVRLEDGPHPPGHRHDAGLALGPKRAALALNPQAPLLPLDLLRRQAAQFGNP